MAHASCHTLFSPLPACLPACLFSANSYLISDGAGSGGGGRKTRTQARDNFARLNPGAMSAGRAQPKLSKAQSFPLSAEHHGAAPCWRLLIATLHSACPPPHDVRPAEANPREPVHRSRRHGLVQWRECPAPEKERIGPAEDGAPRTLPERRAGTGYQGLMGQGASLPRP